MKVLRQLQEKYDDQILNQDQETALVQKKTMSWKEFGRMGGRPSATAREELRGLAGGKRSNRKGHVEESRKKEFTAYQKMKIVEDINQKIDQGLYQDQGDKKFWPSEAKKLGISSERLKDIMARESEWTFLVQKHQLSTRGKRQRKKDSKYHRASGGGRKREFQHQINQLKYWLHRERSAGHSISREDVTKEMEQYAISLINWIGAKSSSNEQSAEISPQEEKIRAQPTWQGIDHKLWLLGASLESELESANIVASPSPAIKHRPLFSINMSDQVPLWAKAVPSRMIFSEHELAGHSYQQRKRISELGEERSCITVGQEEISGWSSGTSNHWGDLARGPSEADIRKQNIQNRISSREMEDLI